MSISIAANGTILLEGSCPHEDAEPLLQLLLSTPGAAVDWRRCTALHSAVIQVLLVAKPTLQGTPGGAELAHWLSPVLARPAQ